MGKEIDYIAWQNRATYYYIASRLLALNKIWPPAVFCGQQALENLLKATLIYWDKSFDPIKACHNFPKMLRIIRNKVRNSANVNISENFYYEKRYQEFSRYPISGKGLLFLGDFLNDLDEAFYSLLVLVPFQFNSVLSNIFKKNKPQVKILRKKNNQIRKIKKFLLK